MEIRPGDSFSKWTRSRNFVRGLLNEGAELYAVEKDPTLAQYLTEQLTQDTPSHLLNADCTQVPLGLLPDSANDAAFKIVANLPYGGDPWDSILSGRLPQRMVLMLQKKRLIATQLPPIKNFGAISIFLNRPIRFIQHTRYPLLAFIPNRKWIHA